MVEAGVESAWNGDTWIVRAGGDWVLSAAASIAPRVKALNPDRRPEAVVVDLSGLERLDTVGALLLKELARNLSTQDLAVRIEGLQADQAALFESVPAPAAQGAARTERRDILAPVVQLGVWANGFGRTALEMVAFLGLVVVTLGGTIMHPRRLRLTSLVHHMQAAGFAAMPILGLLSFLIGVVLAYQGADQLRRFGADIYVVNLLGISVLREIGILLTAIIIAGRSGSAFTAQIGTMKVNQEVDAMQTLGLDPIELLVLPRILALVLTLPLLAFYASCMALLGGALMAYGALDITFEAFMVQFQSAVPLRMLWLGLAKAPVFAFVIAMVGCHEGLRVTGSAESVGRLTTQSVVESIFLVIVIDAVFSIIFSLLRL